MKNPRKLIAASPLVLANTAFAEITAQVPEPSVLGLMVAAGLAGILFIRR